jgi:predicted esterase
MATAMSRPLSQLLYARIQDIPASPRVITFHGYKGHGEDPAALGRAAAPHARIIGLQSYKGVYVGRHVVGYTWYVGPNDRPSPVFFGDALSEIERFLWDELDRQANDQPERPFLLGVEQGAVMALGAALAVPDLISGVISVDGALPVVPGWEPPLAPLAGLPVLLLGDLAATSEAPILRREALARQFDAWGADACWSSTGSEAERDREMADWLARQTARFGYPPDDR